MPFNYTPYQSPYSVAIADLIGKRGDIAAQAAQNRAAAQANMVQGITSAASGALADYVKRQQEAPARELQQLQLQSARQQMADADESRAAGNKLAELMSGNAPNVVNTIGDVKQLNPDAINQAMTQSGFGRWMLDHGDKVTAFNQVQQQLHDLKQKSIGNAVSIFAATPDALKLDAAKTLLDAFHGTGTLPTDVEARLVDQIGTGDLSGITALAQPYMPKPEDRVVGNRVVRFTPGQMPQVILGAEQNLDERTREAFGTPEEQRTPDQQRLVAGVTAQSAATRAPERPTTQNQFLDTFAQGLGLSDRSAMNAKQFQQGLVAYRNATTRPPASSGATQAVNNPYSGAVSRLAANLPANRSNLIISNWNNAVQSGDADTQRFALRSLASETLPQRDQSAMMSRYNVMQSLERIQEALKDVPQNIVSGNLQKVLSKLGTGDEQQRAVATRIQLAVNDYVRSMTGAQFSEREYQRYRSVFPDLTNVAGINRTVLTTLLDEMRNADRSSLEAALGGDKKTAAFIVGGQNTTRQEF